MKKLFQIGAIGLMLLLVARPSFNAAVCAANASSGAPCVTDCPMSMSAMGVDCPMSDQSAVAPCQFDCCQQTLAQSPAQPGASQKHRLLTALVFVPPVAVLQGNHPDLLLRPPDTSSGPERHILLRVIRI